jgi:hypothetical protein
VGRRTGLDDAEGRKSCPYRDSNSNSSAFLPVASRYTDCAIPAPPNIDVVFTKLNSSGYRLCGLLVRVSGYRSRGPGFDSRRFQIF